MLVFDMEGLEYLSSAGLRGLFRAQKLMRERGGKAVLVHLQPQVKKVLDIVKAVELDSVFRSTEELDKYLDAMQKKVVNEDAGAASSPVEQPFR